MCIYLGRSIDQNEDFEDWSDEDLKERVELVCKFDRLCDDIREQFLQCCRPDCIQTQTVTIVTERRYLVLRRISHDTVALYQRRLPCHP